MAMSTVHTKVLPGQIKELIEALMVIVLAALIGLAWLGVRGINEAKAGLELLSRAGSERVTATNTSYSAVSLYSRVLAPVARVSTSKGMGSGAYIGELRVLTAAHVVVKDGKPYQTTGIAIALDGGRISTTGTLIGWDAAKDIAIIRLDVDPGIAPLELRRTGSDLVGQSAYIVGYPLGGSGNPMITGGIISRFTEVSSGLGTQGLLLEHTIVGPPGSSGAPILDSNGRLVGMHQAEFMDGCQSGFLGTMCRVGLYRGIAADEIIDSPLVLSPNLGPRGVRLL